MRQEATPQTGQAGKGQKVLERYASLLLEVDKKCDEVFKNTEIPCKNKCFECCKQLFPLSFVEAYYISEGIKSLDRGTRRKLALAAQKTNEKILKLNPQSLEKRGVDRKTALNVHADFARSLHKIERDCPALDTGVTLSLSKGACKIYPFRNHDCRSMGCSFDSSSNEIIGCFRFTNLKHLIPNLMPFNYLYSEKMKLDTELIKEVTNGLFGENLIYLTTICAPFLKDFGTTDWTKFFSSKNVPERAEKDKYWVVVDV